MIVEVALALVLLVGSALLIRTSMALGAVEPGFDANNVLTMRMSLSGPRFLKADAVERLVRDGVTRLKPCPEWSWPPQPVAFHWKADTVWGLILLGGRRKTIIRLREGPDG